MKNYLLLLYLIFLSCYCLGQTINGRVLAKDNELPLPSSTVKTLMGRETTVTDANGYFTISLKTDTDTLLISSLGYQFRKLAVSRRTSGIVTIRLVPKSSRLEEVNVSTGYYSLPKERATGSFTQISNEQLNRTISTDILSRLKGVANSLSFDERLGGTPNISVRGLSTLYAETQPLIVLNGFPFDGDISQINPNDVENITILKDAAAASIWGVRAANGVLVINTKKGAADQPAHISFNSNMSIGQKPDMFYKPTISSADFIEVERFLFGNNYYQSLENNRNRPPLTPAVELMILNRDGLLADSELNQRLSDMGRQDVRGDFNKHWYTQTINQQYGVSMSGGSEKSTYYYALGYDNNRDELQARYQRFSLRADQHFQVNNRLSINPTISWIADWSDAGKQPADMVRPSPTLQPYPYARLVDANGNPLAIERDYRNGFKNAAEAAGLKNWDYVPLTDYRERALSAAQNQLLLGMNVDYKLSKQLTAQVQYQYGRNEGHVDDNYSEDAYFTRNLVNSYTQLQQNGTFFYPIPDKGGIRDTRHSLLVSHNIRSQLKYDHNWDKHRVNGLIGAEIRELKTTGNDSRVYGFQQSGQLNQLVDYRTAYPQYYNEGLLLSIPSAQGFSNQTNRFVSYYANVAYAYDGKYTLSGSARKDASNYFGVNSNQKAVPLWSAGLGWNLSEEDFFKVGWLNYFKLRATYGFNGNLSRTLTALATVRQSNPSGNSNLNNIPYGMVSTYPNANLRWEKVKVINVGSDFEMLHNRINGSIEYYVKNAMDLVGDQPIDPTVGIPAGTVRRNVANMQTKGLDIQLNVKWLNHGFKWQTALLYNYNANKLTKYYNNPNASGSSYINSGLAIKPIEGKTAFNVMAYRWAGLHPETGNPQGWVDGQASDNYTTLMSRSSLDDLRYFGSALPTTFGSIANTFDYKSFSLFVNVVYRFNYYFLRNSISYSALYNSWNGHRDFEDRWKKPGDELYTNVPSMIYPVNSNRDNFYRSSEVLVEKGDNIRLQDIQLSYRLRRAVLTKLPFNQLQFFANVRNAGFIWRANKQGLDPDISSTSLPQVRMFSFGVKGTL